jgi:hypothetical protein
MPGAVGVAVCTAGVDAGFVAGGGTCVAQPASASTRVRTGAEVSAGRTALNHAREGCGHRVIAAEGSMRFRIEKPLFSRWMNAAVSFADVKTHGEDATQ